MVAKSQKGLQAMMDRLDRTSREYGMKINIKKTKVLKISKGKETMFRINIGGKEIEKVKEFCYLGSVITTDAKCHREIRSILKEKRTFERKSKQNIEDTYDKDTDMECGAVWSRNMDNEERRYKKT